MTSCSWKCWFCQGPRAPVLPCFCYIKPGPIMNHSQYHQKWLGINSFFVRGCWWVFHMPVFHEIGIPFMTNQTNQTNQYSMVILGFDHCSCLMPPLFSWVFFFTSGLTAGLLVATIKLVDGGNTGARRATNTTGCHIGLTGNWQLIQIGHWTRVFDG